MKKYLIAGGAAVAVFAMSAFAASLTVDGGVIQAGNDNDLKCTEQVDVDFTGFEGDLANAGGERVGGGWNATVVSGLGDACDGAQVYVRIFDNEGDEIWRGDPLKTAAGDTFSYSFASGKTSSGYSLFGANAGQTQGGGTHILSEDIAEVEVQIDG